MLSRIRHRMPSGARIAIALAVLALFVALGGGAWALQNPKSQGISRATSVVLSRDATEVSHTLFTIGRVTVAAVCADNGSGGVKLAVSATSSDSGPVLVTPSGSGPVKDSDPFILTGAPSAGQTQFSILDEQGVSATGLAAVSVQSASGPCTISAQAAG